MTGYVQTGSGQPATAGKNPAPLRRSPRQLYRSGHPGQVPAARSAGRTDPSAAARERRLSTSAGTAAEIATTPAATNAARGDATDASTPPPAAPSIVPIAPTPIRSAI